MIFLLFLSILPLFLFLLPIIIIKTSLRISNDFHLLLLSRSVCCFLSREKKDICRLLFFCFIFRFFLFYFRLQNRHQPHQNVYQLNACCQTMMTSYLNHIQDQVNQLDRVYLPAVFLLE